MGGGALMMHCLEELCETEYVGPSDFEDTDVCGVCACVFSL